MRSRRLVSEMKRGLIAAGIIVAVVGGFVLPRALLDQDPEGFMGNDDPTAAEVVALHNATTYEEGLSGLLVTGYTADVEFCAEGRLDVAGTSEVRAWWFLPLRRSTHTCDS